MPRRLQPLHLLLGRRGAGWHVPGLDGRPLAHAPAALLLAGLAPLFAQILGITPVPSGEAVGPNGLLDVEVRREGSLEVLLALERTGEPDPETAERIKSLGCAPAGDRTRYGFDRWRCPHVLARQGFVAAGRLDLAPLWAAGGPPGERKVSVRIPAPARWSSPGTGWRSTAALQSLSLSYAGATPPPPLDLRSGFEGADWIREAGPLALCVAIPLLVALGFRGRVRRLAEERRTEELFSFMTCFGWLAPAAEFTAFFLGFLNEPLPAVLSGGHPIWNPVLRGALVTLPALVIAGGTVSLLAPAYLYWNAPGTSISEVLTLALLRRALYLAPAGCLVAAVTELDVPVMIGCCVVAYGSAAAIWKTLHSRTGLFPVAGGEFHARMLELAARAGVRLRGLLILPRLPAGRANAFAVRGGYVIFTRELLEKLSRREVDAVMAHELGHFKSRHIGLRAAALSSVLVLLIAIQILPALQPYFAIAAPVLGIGGLGGFLALARRQERAADRAAVGLSGDPEALISALGKLVRLNNLPLRWGSKQGRLLTHPSLMERAEWIAGAAAIPLERARDIATGAMEVNGEGYPVPEAAAPHQGVFSDSLRRTMATFVVWSRRLAAVGLPLAIGSVFLRGAYPYDGLLEPAALAVPVFFVLQVLADALLGRAAYPILARRLRESLEREGTLAPGQAAEFVGYSPGDRARIFASFDYWDIAYVWTTPDQLIVAGDRARFALRRDQVTGIQLGPGLPGVIPYKRVYVTWRETPDGAERVVNIRPCAGWSALWDTLRARRIARLLEGWKASPVGESGPAVFGPPRLDEVPGFAIRDLVTWRGAMTEAVMLQVAALAVASLLPGPFDSLLGFYPPLIVFLTRLPVLLSRRR